MTQEYYVIVFSSTHTAIAAQKYLSSFIKVVIMPTLREISDSCGISIRIIPEDFNKVSLLMKEWKMDENMYHFYHISGQGQSTRAVLVDRI